MERKTDQEWVEHYGIFFEGSADIEDNEFVA